MQILKIRRYKSSDNAVVWELHWLGLAQNGVKINTLGPWEKDLNDIENNYLKEGDFILGEIDERVVAMGAFRKKSDEVAEIKRMRVHPDFQKKGFGKTILEQLEKRAKRKGYNKLVLDTSQKWLEAQRFYERNGYKETGRRVFPNNYHATLYEKQLS